MIHYLWGSKSYLWGSKSYLWGCKSYLWGSKSYLWGCKSYLWGCKSYLWGSKCYLWKPQCYLWIPEHLVIKQVIKTLQFGTVTVENLKCVTFFSCNVTSKHFDKVSQKCKHLDEVLYLTSSAMSPSNTLATSSVSSFSKRKTEHLSAWHKFLASCMISFNRIVKSSKNWQTNFNWIEKKNKSNFLKTTKL